MMQSLFVLHAHALHSSIFPCLLVFTLMGPKHRQGVELVNDFWTMIVAAHIRVPAIPNQLCRYESDEEDLEWDQVFNGAPMDDKTEFHGTWGPKAQALLDSLRIKTHQRSKSVSNMRSSGFGQSAAASSQQHSQASQQDTADAYGISNESHSPPQANGFSPGSQSQPDSPQLSEGSHASDEPGPSHAVPSNKRRHIQNDGVPSGPAHVKRHQKASVPMMPCRFSQVSSWAHLSAFIQPHFL